MQYHTIILLYKSNMLYNKESTLFSADYVLELELLFCIFVGKFWHRAETTLISLNDDDDDIVRQVLCQKNITKHIFVTLCIHSIIHPWVYCIAGEAIFGCHTFCVQVANMGKGEESDEEAC